MPRKIDSGRFLHGALPSLLAALLSAPAVAAPDSGVSLTGLLADVDEALDLPRKVARYPTIDPNASCADLSLEVTRLLPHTRSRYASFYDNPANGAAFALGTVFSPAFSLMGVSEYARYREKRHLDNARARVRALRARLADKNCWVR